MTIETVEFLGDCDDYFVLSRRSIEHARKDHKCDSCGGVIPKGAPYNRETALVNGVFLTMARHPLGSSVCTGEVL